MKIKKSEYRKVLDDKYWEGVKNGMKVGIDYPELAKSYVDNINALRVRVQGLKNILTAVNKHFSE